LKPLGIKYKSIGYRIESKRGNHRSRMKKERGRRCNETIADKLCMVE